MLLISSQLATTICHIRQILTQHVQLSVPTRRLKDTFVDGGIATPGVEDVKEPLVTREEDEAVFRRSGSPSAHAVPDVVQDIDGDDGTVVVADPAPAAQPSRGGSGGAKTSFTFPPSEDLTLEEMRAWSKEEKSAFLLQRCAIDPDVVVECEVPGPDGRPCGARFSRWEIRMARRHFIRTHVPKPMDDEEEAPKKHEVPSTPFFTRTFFNSRLQTHTATSIITSVPPRHGSGSATLHTRSNLFIVELNMSNAIELAQHYKAAFIREEGSLAAWASELQSALIVLRHVLVEHDVSLDRHGVVHIVDPNEIDSESTGDFGAACDAFDSFINDYYDPANKYQDGTTFSQPTHQNVDHYLPNCKPAFTVDTPQFNELCTIEDVLRRKDPDSRVGGRGLCHPHAYLPLSEPFPSPRCSTMRHTNMTPTTTPLQTTKSCPSWGVKTWTRPLCGTSTSVPSTMSTTLSPTTGSRGAEQPASPLRALFYDDEESVPPAGIRRESTLEVLDRASLPTAGPSRTASQTRTWWALQRMDSSFGSEFGGSDAVVYGCSERDEGSILSEDEDEEGGPEAVEEEHAEDCVFALHHDDDGSDSTEDGLLGAEAFEEEGPEDDAESQGDNSSDEGVAEDEATEDAPQDVPPPSSPVVGPSSGLRCSTRVRNRPAPFAPPLSKEGQGKG
ncbi:hypothetical protein GSI_10485 [Ganoderma sinense ZZ0214-1]|uniref:Uncharacterized protein n=1 Tax=Ganoderma sinense ZZ0214-1 TaxID=1077348 RepID=A0A2G8S1A8_9APHY|nr:hypothetical protein GSI_10485 [Ganoderma sinense ZZ0214-1]